LGVLSDEGRLEDVERLPRGWLYLTSFVAGLAFDLAALVVCRVFGAPDVSVTVDWAVGLITMAFAVSMLTGLNLGLPEAIRNVGGDAGAYVNTRGGMCLLLFSVAALFVGPAISGLLR
jgi:hypothetical protein